MPRDKTRKTPKARLLYRDDAIVLVDKPAGILTHPNQYDRKSPNLVNSLSGRMHARVYPVHRLDRDTSGLILFAFDKKRARSLGESMQDAAFSKEYLAICGGTMGEEARVTVPVRQGGNGEKQPAESIIRGLSNFTLSDMELCLLAIRLITGRTHQARIHCEAIAKPIIGDSQHGWKPFNARFAELAAVLPPFAAEIPPSDIDESTEAPDLASHVLPPMFLRSWKLSFPHPDSGAKVEALAGLPDSWARIIPSDSIDGLMGELQTKSRVFIDGTEQIHPE
jgi:23S rRNA-/tRNA-specific pseudouridylate synthase